MPWLQPPCVPHQHPLLGPLPPPTPRPPVLAISPPVLLVNQLFKDCEKLKSRIIDFELESAKYILMTKNAHEAYQYLID